MRTAPHPHVDALLHEWQALKPAAWDAPLDALMLQPLAAESIHDLAQQCQQAHTRLYRLMADPARWTVDVLIETSVALVAWAIQRYRAAARPDQRTRWNVVFVVDNSLLPHSFQSTQEGLALLKDPALQRYVKAHDLVVLFVVIGDGERQQGLPVFLDFWRPEDPVQGTKVHVACHALETLHQRLPAVGVNLAGLTLVFDHWYLKPGLIEIVSQLQMHLTSVLAKNEVVTLADGRQMPLKTLVWYLMAEAPKHDGRLGQRGYYWRRRILHARLGPVLLVVRRRPTRKGRFYTYDFLVTTDLTAKAITVLRMLQTRWRVEVFFRDAKQVLGLAASRHHQRPQSLFYCRLRGVTYLLLLRYRQKLRLPRHRKTLGQMKRRLAPELLAYFRQAA